MATYSWARKTNLDYETRNFNDDRTLKYLFRPILSHYG